MKLDQWQEDVLVTKGNMVICSGRQSGKSTIISQDAGEFALNNPNKTIMIISATERQALLLFEKVLSYIHLKDKSKIKTGKDKPLKTRLKLKNGSTIHCLPTGDSGYGIRGYTIDRLYADEAHFIKEEVWAAVTPMLATTGGDIILLSTPFGCEGYFYRCFHDKKFTRFHINTEDVAEAREEPQRSRMLEFLKDEKDRMTKLQYRQEYLGEFVGGIQRFLTDAQIDEICVIETHKPIGDKFQGIDIARMGGDECPMVSLDRVNRKMLYQFDIEIPEPQKLTDTARLIIHKDKAINHKKIFMDDGGLGVGVFDILYEDKQTKNKVIGLNNAKREIERTMKKGKLKIKSKTLLGVDMFINFKNLVEEGKIKLLNDPRVKQSLRSLQMDNSDGVLKIYGNYDHIAEALKRAAWCMKDKSLNIMAFC
jgi:hypothetical protein